MHIAQILGPLQNTERFFLADGVALSGLTEILGKLADADTPIGFDVTRAAALHRLAAAAGADADSDIAVVFFEPV